MEKIKFIVYGEPFGKKRPRARVMGKHASVYNPPENERYELKVANAFNQVYQGDFPMWKKDLTGLSAGLECYVKATIRAIYSIPKSFTKKKRDLIEIGFLLPTKKPDLDNIAKTILDGLNGVAFTDDAQVVSLVMSKEYGEFPLVEITLERV